MASASSVADAVPSIWSALQWINTTPNLHMLPLPELLELRAALEELGVAIAAAKQKKLADEARERDGCSGGVVGVR